MVEIRYKENFEVADVAGKSLADIRSDYTAKFGIPDKAKAKLNDRKVGFRQESEIKLRDCDEVRFAVEKGGKGALLAGALLLALATTGGVFAFGYLTNTTTLAVTTGGGDFASVTVLGGPTWKVFGYQKGTIPAGDLFKISTQPTATDNYTGNLAVVVSIANGSDLVKVYRQLSFLLKVRNSADALVDINSDNDSDVDDDYVLLNLDNGSVNLAINQYAGSDNYTISVVKGFYQAHVFPSGTATPWPTDSWKPILYADVAQR